jgi:hypothetical protein
MSAPVASPTKTETEREAERDPAPSCAEAQADGVPCETVEGTCEECGRAPGATPGPKAREGGEG